MIFRTSVRQAGDVVILDVSGRIVLGDGSREVRDRIAELVKAGHKKILLNLAEVSYVDSSGLGELVSSYSNVTNAGGKIKLVNIQPKVADLLKITRLYSVFESFSAESQAVASFHENQQAASA